MLANDLLLLSRLAVPLAGAAVRVWAKLSLLACAQLVQYFSWATGTDSDFHAAVRKVTWGSCDSVSQGHVGQEQCWVFISTSSLASSSSLQESHVRFGWSVAFLIFTFFSEIRLYFEELLNAWFHLEPFLWTWLDRGPPTVPGKQNGHSPALPTALASVRPGSELWVETFWVVIFLFNFSFQARLVVRMEVLY